MEHAEDRQGECTQGRAFHPEIKDDERTRCEIWTRVMGYHRPVSSFNIGKKGEFKERKYFEESCAGLAA